MTFEERVEELRIALTIWPGSYEVALRAAFPDLYGEKPTAWIAPWHRHRSASS